MNRPTKLRIFSSGIILLLSVGVVAGQTILQPVFDTRSYAFTRTNGIGASGNLSAAGAGKVITLTPAPKGLSSGTSSVYLSGGAGTAEGVTVTATTCVVGGGSSCTITVTTSNTHTGAWKVSTAWNGAQEAVNAACAAGGGTVSIPSGSITIHGTLSIPCSNIAIQGAGGMCCGLGTWVHRTGDFGDSIVLGSPTNQANNIKLLDFALSQDLFYQQGSPGTISNKPTTGAHIRIWGSNTVIIERMRLDALVQNIVATGVNSLTIRDSQLSGLWHISDSTLQVTTADILVNQSASGQGSNIPTYVSLINNTFGGLSAGGTAGLLGARQAVEIDACEDCYIEGGSIGQSVVENVLLQGTSPYNLLNVRIHNVKFDGVDGGIDLKIGTDGTITPTNITIDGSVFNGEANSLSAINVPYLGLTAEGINTLTITGNQFLAFRATPILIEDGFGFNVSNNLIRAYNTANAYSTPIFSSAIYFGSRASNGIVANNAYGCGQNYEAFGGSTNYANFGVSLADRIGYQGSIHLAGNYPACNGAINPANNSALELITLAPEVSTPANPVTGFIKYYGKSGTLCSLSSAGVETCTGGSGGGSYSLPNANYTTLGGVTMSTNTSAVAVATDDSRNSNARLPSAGTTLVAQKFFGTSAPGSVPNNLPGDTFTETTGHHEYVCNAPSGTAAPACTSVTAAGWLLLNGGTGGGAGTVTNVATTSPITGGAITGSGTIGLDTTKVAQKFFGTSAPGSVPNNLPGDTFTETTGHHEYVCNAPSGTAAPACTSVTAAGWLLVTSASAFMGSTATNPAFNSTPTFSLADVSTQSPTRIEPGALTSNVTSVAFTNKTAGAKFSIAWLQDGTGGRTVAYGASATGACAVDPTASITTTQQFEVGPGGTTVNGTGCTTNQVGSNFTGPEMAAPGTPPATAATCWFDSTAHSGWQCKANNSTTVYGMVLAALTLPASGTVPAMIASGVALALGTAPISANACASAVTATAAGAGTTDRISYTPNADISGVTGYGSASTDGLMIYPYPTSGNVNFKVCNLTGTSITPGAVSLNWAVVR